MTAFAPRIWGGKRVCIPDLETMMVPLVLGVRRAHAFLGLAALCLLTAACSAVPDQLAGGPDPADPAVRVPATDYRSVLSGYARQRPVEPAPWREQNDRVAPAQKR